MRLDPDSEPDRILNPQRGLRLKGTVPQDYSPRFSFIRNNFYNDLNFSIIIFLVKLMKHIN
jgi:hypothetical protein